MSNIDVAEIIWKSSTSTTVQQSRFACKHASMQATAATVLIKEQSALWVRLIVRQLRRTGVKPHWSYACHPAKDPPGTNKGKGSFEIVCFVFRKAAVALIH